MRLIIFKASLASFVFVLASTLAAEAQSPQPSTPSTEIKWPECLVGREPETSPTETITPEEKRLEYMRRQLRHLQNLQAVIRQVYRCGMWVPD